MDSFFIGPPEKQIFSTWLPARDSEDKKGAVLLCYPFGQEYLRAHRAFRQLATMLSRAGYDVLRFDYPGSGDSYGDVAVESFAELVAELSSVVSVLRERGGDKPLYVCGLRFGALVAASLAETFASFDDMILWDPYSSGSDFVADCLSQVADPEAVTEAQVWQLHGFPLSPAFREEIKNFDLAGCNLRDSMHVSLVLSHENAYSNRVEEIFSSRPGGFHRHLVRSNGDWNYVDRDGSILIPTKLIREIARLPGRAA